MKNEETVRAKLLSKRQELSDRLARLNAGARRGLDRDWEEQASELANTQVHEALGHEATEEIGLIDQALQRLETGTYGVCMSCGKRIPLARLDVRPYADRCLECGSVE